MKTIQVAGTNLYSVAAAELGDATQWYRIAALNGLADPMIFGLCSLAIPVTDRTLTDGIPAQ
jgi:hypothetical protein